MPTNTKRGAAPPPAPTADAGRGPREAAAVWLVNQDTTTDSDLLAYLTVELARQGDVLDRLTALLPAAEAAAAKLAHPIRSALGRGGPVTTATSGHVDLTGGKPR